MTTSIHHAAQRYRNEARKVWLEARRTKDPHTRRGLIFRKERLEKIARELEAADERRRAR